MPRLTKQLIPALLLLAVAACGGSSTSPTITTSSAPYSQTDLVAGFGAEATAGRTVTVSYTLWLYDSAATAGKGRQIESNPSFPFLLGAGRVIPGWDSGVLGIKDGGQRRLTIPPNATILFDITLLGVQ